MLNQQVANPVLNPEIGKSLLHVVASEDHIEKIAICNHGTGGNSIQLKLSPELIQFEKVGLAIDYTRDEIILYNDPDGPKGTLDKKRNKRVLVFGRKWHKYQPEELHGTTTQHLTIKSKDKNQLVLNGTFDLTKIKEKKGNRKMNTQEDAIPVHNKSIEQDMEPKSGTRILKDILNYKLIQGGNASKNYQALPPKYITKLLDEGYFKTYAELADALGVSGSVISSGVKQGRISATIELGARAIYIGKYFASGAFEDNGFTIVDHLTEVNKAIKNGLKLNQREDGILGVEQTQYYYPGE